jgi:hypothetical protein
VTTFFLDCGFLLSQSSNLIINLLDDAHVRGFLGHVALMQVCSLVGGQMQPCGGITG